MSLRVLSFGSLLVACITVVAHNVTLGSWMLDDAFIFFRYAENWAGGHGLVFNTGKEPVEGFTSFLWLALLTFGKFCGIELVHVAVGLGYMLAFATLVLVNQSHRWLDEIDVETSAFATLFLGTCGAFTPWVRGGMETLLHAFLITAVLLLYLRVKERGRGADGAAFSFVAIGLLFALIGMNRPDGLVVVALLGVDALLARRSVAWGGVGATAAVFVVVFGAYYAWRFSYFGYPFPNTFYAKVGASTSQVTRGLGYAGRAALVFAPLLVLPFAVGKGWRRVNPTYLVLPVLLTVYTIYIISVGGDIMPAYRFFTPVLPALCLLAALALRALSSAVRAPGAAVTAVFGLVVIFTMITPSIRSDTVAHNGRIVGSWLRANAPEGAVVATNTAGTVVFYSGLESIDMLGLNDLHIARVVVADMGSGHAGHEKGDGDYVLRRRPEFIHLGSSLGWYPLKAIPLPPFPGDRQIWANPEFKANYKFLSRTGDTLWPGGAVCGHFGIWVRNDVFEKLESNK